MNYLNDLAKTLDQYCIKLPAFPKGIKDFIAQITPWLALIFGVMAVLSGISAFGGLSLLTPFVAIEGIYGYTITAMLSAVVLLIQGVIELMAFSPLKAGKAKGWNLLYYALVLGVVGSILTLNVSSVLGSLIGALIGYYFLYQIKSYYK